MGVAHDIPVGPLPVDPVGFSELYHEYGPRILRYLESALRNEAEAEDATHEVFLKAWRSAPWGSGDDSLRAWLFTVARTTAIDHARRRSHAQPVTPQVVVALADRRGAIARDRAAHWITEPEVYAVLRRLPQRHQEVIVLRYLMGCSHAETARILDTSELAVRKVHQRALAVLAQELASSELAADRARRAHPMQELRMPRRMVLGGFSLLPRSITRVRGRLATLH